MGNLKRKSGHKASQKHESLLKEAATKYSKDQLFLDFLEKFSKKILTQPILKSQYPGLLEKVHLFYELSKIRKRDAVHSCVKRFEDNEEGRKIERTHLFISCNNIPFILDSICSFLNEEGLTIKFITHPILNVNRDANGNAISFNVPDVESGNEQCLEAFIYIEIHESLDATEEKQLHKRIQKIIDDVCLAVADWQSMRGAIQQTIEEYTFVNIEGVDEGLREIQDFLRWIDSGYFTFLGFQEYKFSYDKARKVSGAKLAHKLGINKTNNRDLFGSIDLEKDVFEGADKTPQSLHDVFTLTKTIAHSTVHRPVPMDVIRIKTLNKLGQITGERQFFGLYTSTVYNQSVKNIPILRNKLKDVLLTSGLSPHWHDGKALIHLIESFPCDELFQFTVSQLLTLCMNVMTLQEQPRLYVYVRRSDMGHFVSCFVYVPRDRYTSDLRKRISVILSMEFGGEVIFFQTLMEGDLVSARVNFIIRLTKEGVDKEIDIQAIEEKLQRASLGWADYLQKSLIDVFGEVEGRKIGKTYENAFPISYQEKSPITETLKDIQFIEKVLSTQKLGIKLTCTKVANKAQVALKLYHLDSAIPLSDILPVLENMGFYVLSEVPYRVDLRSIDRQIWIHDFELGVSRASLSVPFEDLAPYLEECLALIWEQEIENDGFNEIVLSAGVSAREVVLLRAYYKYLKQTPFPYSESYVVEVFVHYAMLAKALIALFTDVFKGANQEIVKQGVHRVEDLLNDVPSFESDRIIRTFLKLVLATVRTNFYQKDAGGSPKRYLSFKLNTSELDFLPDPRPVHEVFVYSPEMEAVHLRGGKVARGGIRWSDRMEDFRTEILGLVKAQLVKNAVIVPTGAKGGFIVKKDLKVLSFEERQKIGIRCYKMMIRGLLDVTDNIVDGKVIPPKDVHRRDEDDTYLVVAADKGTATFSDIANELSAEYNFWLGDGFASGGSVGYDHKKMGITAKGAWESVKRHFREFGVDTQKEPFTVAGVGDMNGDVFGNGMLLSEKIRLVAAFNHMHIFIDPDPDPAMSFKERKRLFNLSRSTWEDYDKSRLSKGGKIFKRSDKVLSLTPEIQKLLNVSSSKIDPNSLIRAILKLNVDLLWFGGIGTFVCAEGESTEDVGDKNNDAIRVYGKELSCKVIGEGANLGLTQRGRIEYALKGGRLNTDAIDNSAGVDCSDHEVNIKILLKTLIGEKKISLKERNTLLESMTEDVSELVLRHNYLQGQAITMVESRGSAVLERQNRLMRTLEHHGRLNRKMEYLPTEEEVETRLTQNKGLTRPEISVLLAYGKIFAYDQVVSSTLPDLSVLSKNLTSYFPDILQKKYQKYIEIHPLRREIIATFAANSFVNRVGPTFLNEMMELTDASPTQVIKAYLIIRESFNLQDTWQAIESLDYEVNSKVQTRMLLNIVELIEHNSYWILRSDIDIEQFVEMIPTIQSFVDEVKPKFLASLSGLMEGVVSSRTQSLISKGVPEAVALEIGSFRALNNGIHIMILANSLMVNPSLVAAMFFRVGELFSIEWLRQSVEKISIESDWRKRASRLILNDLQNLQGEFTKYFLKGTKEKDDESIKEMLEEWQNKEKDKMISFNCLLNELKAIEVVEMSMFVVAVQELKKLLKN